MYFIHITVSTLANDFKSLNKFNLLQQIYIFGLFKKTRSLSVDPWLRTSAVGYNTNVFVIGNDTIYYLCRKEVT